MDAATIKDRVVELIVDQLGVSKEEATPQASFLDDLGADSLDIVELVMSFEEEFDLEIPDEDVEKIQTIDYAITYLQERIGS
ncbi:MAG: acyl carrier protein [Myxococcota bacterium]|nr:acyl carrier protein [bacterium]MED5262448.1 acyl carrier protein [Myxococcota bacterium]